MNSTTQNTERDNQQYKPNPYGSIKVATPFQDHVDYKQLYQAEFESLKRIINDIKHDNNHQSQGVVVIGEPGSGKTHLMMRLAKELLKVNRLLFIPQPAHPDSVLYHTYSRILESFFEEVPGTKVRQLEHLLANSFVKLISTTTIMTLTNRDQEILAATRENPLNLYESLGTEGSNARLAYWQRIETRTNNWWMDKYGTAGYSPQIIKGIVKFCSYSNLRKKELVARWLSANELTQEELDNIGLSNWNEEMSKEEFSLQAISVFSRLSLLDEPLIIVFDQLESLGYEHKRNLLISFGEAVKEIFTHVPNSLIILNLFPDRWKQFQDIFDGSIVDLVSQHEIYLQKPSNEKLQEILRLKAQAVGVDFDGLFNSEELEDICKQESIRKVLKRAANYYKYKVDGIRFSEEIERLNNTANGRFMIMEKEDRINFELIYRLITDIQNKDEEFEIEKALQVLMSELENYWLIKVFQFEEI
jgi:Cdc6-like AAA superfamily ATPase